MDAWADVRPVPLVNFAAQQGELHEEVMVELAEFFATVSFIGGPAAANFEAPNASFVGAGHCVGVANGTDDLNLPCMQAVSAVAGKCYSRE